MVCSTEDGMQNFFFFFLKLGQLQPSHWGEPSRDGECHDRIQRKKQKTVSCLMNEVDVGAEELTGTGKGASAQTGV